MQNDTLNISIHETSRFSDFLGYIRLIIKEKLYRWIEWVIIVRMTKNPRFVIIKNNEEIIGGFCVTNFPLPKIKVYNWFNRKVQRKFDELTEKGYKYFCCFVVKKSYRNKGIGTYIFDQYIKKNHEKIWFTSSTKAIPFYLRNGAELFYKSRYNIYVFDNKPMFTK